MAAAASPRPPGREMPRPRRRSDSPTTTWPRNAPAATSQRLPEARKTFSAPAPRAPRGARRRRKNSCARSRPRRAAARGAFEHERAPGRFRAAPPRRRALRPSQTRSARRAAAAGRTSARRGSALLRLLRARPRRPRRPRGGRLRVWTIPAGVTGLFCRRSSAIAGSLSSGGLSTIRRRRGFRRLRKFAL